MIKPNFEDMQAEIANLKEQLFLKKSTIAGLKDEIATLSNNCKIYKESLVRQTEEVNKQLGEINKLPK